MPVHRPGQRRTPRHATTTAIPQARSWTCTGNSRAHARKAGKTSQRTAGRASQAAPAAGRPRGTSRKTTRRNERTATRWEGERPEPGLRIDHSTELEQLEPYGYRRLERFVFSFSLRVAASVLRRTSRGAPAAAAPHEVHMLRLETEAFLTRNRSSRGTCPHEGNGGTFTKV